ncbi:unnamed protein product (macronuclear) [Paramecium tetraurelia]|uniref:Uncharacterized protein n=1 Tax=Paramecium tetraurelia TaxID=5888 RepID=A0CAL0_PARTE|nr:uncharacterized protein GSPATT00036607001 [Paramecium tetraurelia]CAK67827.1 unnamed protein product [Paramecium tetraurelia]|eukprot:XP_001435224.1 hypothetical protein (macronuclear) [Paramecium tetraurelia strain d4-2]
MIMDDKIQRILQMNDFQRSSDIRKISQSQVTENTNKTYSITVTNQSKPKRRKVVKLKNHLLQSHVSPDIQKLYYQTKKNEDSTQHNQTEQTKSINLPSISDQSNKGNLNEFIALVLEVFPPDHQLWMDLQIKDQQLEEVIAQNQNYFSDLLMLYIQEMEIRQLKDKKLGYKGKYTTQYSEDFSDKINKDNTSINRWIYDRIKQSNTFLQNISTYNQHYIPKRYDKIGNFKPDHKPNLNEISCLSSYAVNYRDWKKQYHGLIGPINSSSEKKLPFVAETNYTRNFVTQKYEKQDPIIPKQLGPFPNQPKTLIRDTTHKSQFCLPQQDNSSTQNLVYSQRTNHIKSFDGYQPHYNKQSTISNQGEDFADRFYHSSIVQKLMKKSQKQQNN